MKHGLSWNKDGERLFEAGLDRGVLYTPGNPGVAWNGLISVDQSPTGGTAQAHYIDGVAYYQHTTLEETAGTIQAFTYPDEFMAVGAVLETGDGLFLEQQDRIPFGLSYRTRVGNDTRGLSHNYRIHLVYNVIATPSTQSNSSLLNAIAPVNFSWGFVTTPVKVPGRRYTAKIYIDRNRSDPKKFDYFEHILYGTDRFIAPRLPSLSEVVELFSPSYVFPGTDAP